MKKELKQELKKHSLSILEQLQGIDKEIQVMNEKLGGEANAAARYVDNERRSLKAFNNDLIYFWYNGSAKFLTKKEADKYYYE